MEVRKFKIFGVLREDCCQPTWICYLSRTMETITHLRTSKQNQRESLPPVRPSKGNSKAALTFFRKEVNTDGRSEMNKGMRSKESAKYVVNCK